jgi:hypothetical protein
VENQHFPAKHKRATRGRDPHRDSRSGCDAGDVAQQTGAHSRTPGDAPFRVVKTIVESIRTCLENPGVWGKAPVSAGQQTPPFLWNNPADITTKTDSKYDESVENTPNIYDDNLVKRHDDNSAINNSPTAATGPPQMSRLRPVSPSVQIHRRETIRPSLENPGVWGKAPVGTRRRSRARCGTISRILRP